MSLHSEEIEPSLLWKNKVKHVPIINKCVQDAREAKLGHLQKTNAIAIEFKSDIIATIIIKKGAFPNCQFIMKAINNNTLKNKVVAIILLS